MITFALDVFAESFSLQYLLDSSTVKIMTFRLVRAAKRARLGEN